MMTLLPTEIHLWPIKLDLPVMHTSQFADLLSADEAARAGRCRSPRDRHSFTASRALLRILLGRYLELKPETIHFSYGEAGKPRLTNLFPVHFNVSHSGSMALFAFQLNVEIGVDIEEIRPLNDLSGIAEQFFCAEEYQELMSLSPALREQAFFHCWTRKEAYLKAVGEGFRIALDQFRVTLRPQDAARLLHIDHDSEQASDWTLHNLDVDPDYAAAVAYRDQPKTLRIITYSANLLTD